MPEDLVVGRAIANRPLSNAGPLPTPATFENLPAGKIPAPTTAVIDADPRRTVEPDKGEGIDIGSTSDDTRKQTVSFVKELFLVVIGAIVVSSLLRAFVGQMFIIPSSSMENTLLIGDRVVVEKITDFKRGDVVVFADPGGWLSSRNAGTRSDRPILRVRGSVA